MYPAPSICPQHSHQEQHAPMLLPPPPPPYLLGHWSERLPPSSPPDASGQLRYNGRGHGSELTSHLLVGMNMWDSVLPDKPLVLLNLHSSSPVELLLVGVCLRFSCLLFGSAVCRVMSV